MDPIRYSRANQADGSVQLRVPLCPAAGVGGPKKVLVLCHSYYPDSTGGTERVARLLAKELAAGGNKAVVLAYSARRQDEYSGKSGDILFEREMVDGVPVVRLRHKAAKRGLLKDFPPDPAMETFAERFLQAERPDIVHFLHLGRLYSFSRACMRQGVPYLVTLTDFFGVCHYSTRIDKQGAVCSGSEKGSRCATVCPSAQVSDFCGRYHAAAALLAGAALVAAPSGYVAQVYEREFPGLRVEVIPHGVGDEFLWQSKQGVPVRFGYVGKLAELKGVSLLLRAFRSLPQGCTLDVYGDGNAAYLRKLRRLARGNAQIRFHGQVDPGQMPEVFQRLDCVVIPSVVPETYNFVLREGLQSGCLVVAANTGAMAEVLAELPNGVGFTPGDEKALCVALNQTRERKLEQLCPVRFSTPEQEANVYMRCYQTVKGE